MCAYALGTAGEDPASPPEITAAMIETLVPKTAEATAFLLANALAAGTSKGPTATWTPCSPRTRSPSPF